MKKFSLFITILAAVSMIACQKEQEKEIEPVNEPEKEVVLTTISATAGDVATKAYVDGLQVKWSAADVIAVANEEDDIVEFTLNGGENTASATFSGDLSGKALGTYAVYPKTTNSAISGATASIDYLDTWSYGKSEVPMYGINNGSGEYSFHNIGGAIQVTYSNIPETASAKYFKLSETHTGGTAKYITGTVDITGLDTAPAVDLSHLNGQEVTVSGIAKDANTVTIVIPVPASSGYNFQVALYEAGNLSPIPGSVKNASNKTINSGRILRFPEIVIPEAKTFFEERFASSTGTCSTFNNTDGNGTFVADNMGWTVKDDKKYGAGASAKFGTSSVTGEATTPSISIPAAYRSLPISLHFKAAPWSKASTVTGLDLTVTGATISSSSVTMTKDAWEEFDLTLTGLSETLTIKFSCGERFFLDDVLVFFGFSIPAELPQPGFSYSEHSYTAATSGTFIAPTLSNPNSVTGITYSSSDEDIATVDENTGEVTIGSKAGTVRITAFFGGSASYRSWSDYYDIDVSDPIYVYYWINGVKTTVIAAEGQALNTLLPASPDCGISGYEFTGWSESTVTTTDTEPIYTSQTVVPALGITLYAVFVKVTEEDVAAGDVTYDTLDFSSRGTSGSGSSFIHDEGGVVFSFSKAYESGTSHIKLYAGCDVSLTASRIITKVVVSFISGYTKLSGDGFSISSTTGTWSGSATEVNLSNTESSQARVTSIVVSLAAGKIITYSGYTTSPVA